MELYHSEFFVSDPKHPKGIFANETESSTIQKFPIILVGGIKILVQKSEFFRQKPDKIS